MLQEDIIRILKDHYGKYVSGEELAQVSGITRAGIWKQIEQLRENGYLIESSPRKGYCLTGLPAVLNSLELKDGLNTKVFGQTIYFQNEVDSTNRWAKQLAGQGAVEGTVVVAEIQTNGRGRMGRSWASAQGLGLWFSIILRPRVSASILAGITLMTAVAMTQAIKNTTHIQLQIKWPNDLIYQNQKLVGILAEIHGELDLVNYLILGVGLNVDHRENDFPEILRGLATSLQMIQPGTYSRKTILQEFLKIFEESYYALSEDGMGSNIDYARQHSATIGKTVKINQGFGKVQEGHAVDLDIDGSLIIRDAKGQLIRIYSGDVIEVGGNTNETI